MELRRGCHRGGRLAEEVPRRPEDFAFRLIEIGCAAGKGRRTLTLARRFRELLSKSSPDVVSTVATGGPRALRCDWRWRSFQLMPFYAQAIILEEVQHFAAMDAPRSHRAVSVDHAACSAAYRARGVPGQAAR
jgi:hypothetical protein